MRAIEVACSCLLLALLSSASPVTENPVSHLRDLPDEAQSPISATLGRDFPAYRVRPVGDTFEAANPAQKLSARFTAQRVEVREGNAAWTIAVRAYGYGRTLRPVSSTVPIADGNKIVYRRGSLTEWYVNGPAGLEQGFTVTHSPVHATCQPLTIAMTLSGDIAATLDSSKTRLSLSDSQRVAELQYTSLTARDANGKEIKAWMELRGSELLLKAADQNARYPIVIDPTIKQAKLLASDGGEGDSFGYSVAISGNTLVVGSPFAKVGSNFDQGAAYVFVKPATGGWANATETAKLVSSDGLGSDHFGSSVAINGDQIAVGAPNRSNTAGVVGEAYWYLKPIGGWTGTMTERVNLGTGHSANAQFGTSVGVQNYVVIVGAPGDNAAYLMFCAFGQPTCSIDATFYGADQGPGNNRFGTAVAISGKSFVVTDPYFSGSQAQFQGAAYVYTQTQSGFFSQATLTASDGALISELGISVAISGNTVAVGAPYSAVGNQPTQGAIYVYAKPSTGWVDATETGKLTASDGVSQDQLGMSVSVSGSVIVGGAPRHLVGSNSRQGAGYVYIKSGSWHDQTENLEITPSDGAAFDNFGQSVGISGTTAVGGSIGAKDIFGNAKGAAYTFTQ
jgi:hypothetical protein